MSLALLSAYASDSDSDSGSDSQSQSQSRNGGQHQHQNQRPSTSLSDAPVLPPKTSKPLSGLALPPPSRHQPTPTGTSSPSGSSHTSKAGPSTSSGLALPPPRGVTAKRSDGRFQIKIDALEPLNTSDGEDGAVDGPVVKRKKLDEGSSKGKHALLGMLPAPKRPVPSPALEATPPGKTQPGGLKVVEDIELDDEPKSSEGTEERAAPTGKSNSDFKAMLGIKTAPKASTSTPTPKVSARTAFQGTGARKPSSVAPEGSSSTLKAAAREGGLPTVQTREAEEKSSLSTLPAAVDFFSLGSASAATPPRDAGTASPLRPSVSISAAPTVEEEEQAVPNEAQALADEYPGWAQDETGAWIPVTPEAHAAWAAWHADAQAAQLHDNPAARRRETGAGGGGFDVAELERFAAAGGGVAVVDAGAAARAAWESRPQQLDPRAPTTAARLNAQAAPQLPKGPAKLTSQRARQRGQLSSLLAQASERREELEEKFARGKANKREAGAKYGF